MITGLVDVGSMSELESGRPRVVTAGGRSILLLHSDGRVYALDNRCPHMGFPLHRGTVRDGVLTCHWHHARFDLASGCTFDPFADDVPRFAVEVRDGRILLDPRPIEPDPAEHWTRKLSEGLEQNISLVLAKAALRMREIAPLQTLRTAALFGVRNRDAWTSGLTILTALWSVQDVLDPDDRGPALYHGLLHVARDTEGAPAAHLLDAFNESDATPERFLDWFRHFVDARSSDAAERTLRTAIRVLEPRHVHEMLFAAATDHAYMSVGHTLDAVNKAFELLGHIGWEHADEILPSLLGGGQGLPSATRMEEFSEWRHPDDIPSMLADATHGLRWNGHRVEWHGREGLAEQILDGEPADTLHQLRRLLDDGVAASELSATVAYAAALRAVHFKTTNEIPDWDTVLHTFTYANAVDQAVRRFGGGLVVRGIFDAAMSVYLDRFLNVPKQPIPRPSGRAARPADLLATFDVQGAVDEAGQIAADMCAEGRADDVIRALGHALLREDAGFHDYQMYEAAVRQHGQLPAAAGSLVLTGAVRFLAARFPSVRARGQTWRVASRLARGEALYEID